MTNSFIWYELMTTDVDAAQKFYGAVVGWNMADSGQAGMDYRILMAKTEGIGGMMAIPEEAISMGMRPIWFGYINVPNVDKAVAQIIAVGGKVEWPAVDIPNVGRIARMSDPQGAGFYIMTPSGEGVSKAYAEGIPGHCSWNELRTGDGKGALRFYTEQFGWKNTRNMEMGPECTYHVFSTGAGDVGGIMTKSAEWPLPMWVYYFGVDDIDAATGRIGAAGGTVNFGPEQVPGGGWIIHATDPQGGKFALVGPRR